MNPNRFRFRAWNPISKEMVRPFMLTSANGMMDVDGGPSPMIPMQSTGLSDKNGDEIFEGDICEHNNGFIASVHWTRGSFQWAWYLLGEINSTRIRKIGNIYQTPGLIKTGCI